MNRYFALWTDVNFLVPMLLIILFLVIAIWFKIKWLDKRKKNKVGKEVK